MVAHFNRCPAKFPVLFQIQSELQGCLKIPSQPQGFDHGELFWRFSVAVAQQSRLAQTFTTSRSAAFVCFTSVCAAVKSHNSQNESSVKPCLAHQFLAPLVVGKVCGSSRPLDRNTNGAGKHKRGYPARPSRLLKTACSFVTNLVTRLPGCVTSSATRLPAYAWG